jgi:S1-C subfamily serine protease
LQPIAAIQNVDDQIAEAFGLRTSSGALLSEIMEDSPAEDAGLQSGDVIVAVDDREIGGAAELRSTIASSTPGQQVVLSVIRDGQPLNMTIRLREIPSEFAAASSDESLESLLGFAVANLDRDLAERFNLEYQTQGVVVTGVDQESSAARAGLRQGDVIMGMNRVRVSSVDAFRRASEGAEKGQNMLLKVVRGGRVLYLAFTI